MTNQSAKKQVREMLIKLLHECDHEPDEITKFVVIDQSEFVPKALSQIEEIVMGVIGKINDPVVREMYMNLNDPESYERSVFERSTLRSEQLKRWDDK